jgi:hypothetical protein
LKILFFLVFSPIILCGQRFLDLKLSHQLNSVDYPPSLNIEFGENWWGIEAEVGYQFGKRTYFSLDSNFFSFDYRVEKLRWKLIGNFYPFRKRGAGQGLKLGLGIFDDIELWRDPNYYENLETIRQSPVMRINDQAFKRLEYGIQVGYKYVFWQHLVAEVSYMLTYRRDRFGPYSINAYNSFISFLIGYRFWFESDASFSSLF